MLAVGLATAEVEVPVGVEVGIMRVGVSVGVLVAAVVMVGVKGAGSFGRTGAEYGRVQAQGAIPKTINNELIINFFIRPSHSRLRKLYTFLKTRL